MTYKYKIIQYKNESYSDNNEHHDSVALTDAQHEIKWKLFYIIYNNLQADVLILSVSLKHRDD